MAAFAVVVHRLPSKTGFRRIGVFTKHRPVLFEQTKTGLPLREARSLFIGHRSRASGLT